MNSRDRWAKVRAMSAREVMHRTRYRAFLAYERRLVRRGVTSAPDRLEKSIVEELRRAPDWQEALLRARTNSSKRFFAGVHDRESMRALFAGPYRGELDLGRTKAAEVRRHELTFFGATFSYGERIDWHADPVSWRRWPARYHADISTRRERGAGDVKYVWETNRHQFLVDLAKVAYLDTDGAAASELQALFADWRHACPYGVGAAWTCALEPAFRAFSWLWAYHMLLAAEALDDASHLAWLEGLLDHGRFIHRHLELYSSPFNHLAGEAAALYMLGALLPELSEGAAWRRRGRTELESTLDQQFHRDGGSVEQSTFYHHATLGFYLLAALTGRNHGDEFSPAVWTAIERGLEFSMTLAWPDGRLPSVGGADDGKPIRLEHLPLWDFRPYQAIGAVLFDRGDFKYVAGRFWEDALWLLGPAGRDRFEAMAPTAPRPVSRALPHSGYVSLRSDWTPRADYVCFDVGPQAAGLRRDGVPSAAHGHADALSVIVALDGQRILVDPGFYCYNGEPEWEVHFRRTPAHNTAVVDGRDQARHLSKMAWTHTYDVALESWATESVGGWAIASHDGYLRAPIGVRHRRAVWLRPGGMVILLDEFSGAGAHDLALTFQFAPGLLETARPGGAIFEGRFELAWSATFGITGSVSEGGPSPADGWVAPSLGVRVPAPKLVLSGRFGGPRAAVLTAILDTKRGVPAGFREEPVTTVDGALALTRRSADHQEWVVAAGGVWTSVGPVETDAVLAFVEQSSDLLIRAERIGGTGTIVRPGAGVPERIHELVQSGGMVPRGND